MTEEKKAVIRETGKEVLVYKSKLRGTWINSCDFKTEYKPKELRFR